MEDETGRWIIDLVSFREEILEEFNLDIVWVAKREKLA